jgi:hypothetical protein
MKKGELPDKIQEQGEFKGKYYQSLCVIDPNMCADELLVNDCKSDYKKKKNRENCIDSGRKFIKK